MTHELNGVTHTEYMLTDEEKAVVEAMRLGAEINVSFYSLKELKEVDERIELFAGIKKENFNWIKEFKHNSGKNYISFHKGMKKLSAICYLDIKKD